MCFLNIKACQHILLHQIHKIMIFKKASYDPFLLTSFCGWNTDWAITWGMRCSVMFIRVKTSSRGRNDRVHSRSALLKSAARHGSDMETGADRGRSSQCLCLVYTSSFLNRPRSGSPRRLYSDLSCHIKDCQNTIIYLNFLKKTKKKPVFVWYTCIPNKKTRTKTVWYEYVYRYFHNIYIYIYIYIYINKNYNL